MPNTDVRKGRKAVSMLDAGISLHAGYSASSFLFYSQAAKVGLKLNKDHVFMYCRIKACCVNRNDWHSNC